MSTDKIDVLNELLCDMKDLLDDMRDNVANYRNYSLPKPLSYYQGEVRALNDFMAIVREYIENYENEN